MKKNIVVLASGSGTNFEAIVKAGRRGIFRGTVKLLITDRREAGVRDRARRLGVREVFVDPAGFKDRRALDRAILAILQKEKIGLVVLAGYMRILSSELVRAFKNRILNIHPALLPAFKGMHAITDAYDYGAKFSGVTVHFVDDDVDHGPIIVQAPVAIAPRMTLAQLERKVHTQEHRLYPQAIKLFLEGRLKVSGRRVTIT